MAHGTVGLEPARYQGMLQLLQQQDEEIEQIIGYSKFVVAYLLQQEGPNPGWRKANIEGPVYLVQRRVNPRCQLLVKNQFSTNDLLDTLHPEWELDCQKNYVFYKVEDPSKRIRGLWFHDDNERMRLEQLLEQTLEEVRKGPTKELIPTQTHTMPQHGMPAPAPGLSAPGLSAPGLSLPAEGQQDVMSSAAAGSQVTVSKESLRAAFHSLADDANFLNMVMKKLQGQ